jgi:ribosome-associated protein
LEINHVLSIGEEELLFSFSRSGGPGGQNVNKVNTRVTLCFDVAHSPSLNDEQRERIMSRLATRIDKDGVLHIVAQVHRSQAQNREEAVARLVRLLADALTVLAPRKPTKMSRAARARRVEEKRRRGQVKQSRGPVHGWDE